MVSEHPGFDITDSPDAPADGDSSSGAAGTEEGTENPDALDEFLGNVEDTQTDVLEAVLDREGSNPLETQNLMVRALGCLLYTSSVHAAPAGASVSPAAFRPVCVPASAVSVSGTAAGCSSSKRKLSGERPHTGHFSSSEKSFPSFSSSKM